MRAQPAKFSTVHWKCSQNINFLFLDGATAAYWSKPDIPSFVQITLPKEIALRQVMILPRTVNDANMFVQPMIYVSSTPQGITT